MRNNLGITHACLHFYTAQRHTHSQADMHVYRMYTTLFICSHAHSINVHTRTFNANPRAQPSSQPARSRAGLSDRCIDRKGGMTRQNFRQMCAACARALVYLSLSRARARFSPTRSVWMDVKHSRASARAGHRYMFGILYYKSVDRACACQQNTAIYCMHTYNTHE